MNDWVVLTVLSLQGLVAGVVVFHLVRFQSRGGKLYFTLDETPVGRRLLAAVTVVVVISLTQVITYEINTRKCIENTREVLLGATSTAEIRDYVAEAEC